MEGIQTEAAMPNCGTIPGFPGEIEVYHKETSVRSAGVLTEIQTSISGIQARPTYSFYMFLLSPRKNGLFLQGSGNTDATEI
jgi:hypothetical protein